MQMKVYAIHGLWMGDCYLKCSAVRNSIGFVTEFRAKFFGSCNERNRQEIYALQDKLVAFLLDASITAGSFRAHAV